MTAFMMTAFENTGPFAMWRYRDGDPLVEVGTFTVEASSVRAALEVLWSVGNKMEPDATGTDWPRERRSMCMGDVVEVHEHETIEGVGRWTALRAGWARLGGDE